jgi:hypothetical protein
MSSMHPSQVIKNERISLYGRLASYGLLAASVGLLTLGINIRDLNAKIALYGASWIAAIACRPVRSIITEARHDNEDARAVTHYSWIQHLADAMKPKEVVEFAPSSPEIEPLPLFNWLDLADADSHPVISILSPMGGGKSRLAKFLAKHVLFDAPNAEMKVLDIYGSAVEWGSSAEILTETPEMLEFITQDLEDIAERRQQYKQGIRDFAPSIRIIEEAPDTLSDLLEANEKLTESWMRKLTTVTRKLRIRPVFISVKFSSVDFKIGAESRDQSTVLIPGHKGIAIALKDTRYFKLGTRDNKELQAQVLASIQRMRYPCLVRHDGAWSVGDIPELSSDGDVLGYTPPGDTEFTKRPPLDDSDLDEMLRYAQARMIPPSAIEFSSDQKPRSDYSIDYVDIPKMIGDTSELQDDAVARKAALQQLIEWKKANPERQLMDVAHKLVANMRKNQLSLMTRRQAQRALTYYNFSSDAIAGFFYYLEMEELGTTSGSLDTLTLIPDWEKWR